MVEKQKRLFTLLKEIDTICKNNGIEYVLAGGTLVGAIRHRGFLPWDDDVDIMITRSNWDKLKEAAKTQLPPNRALVAPELDPNYTNSFPRYMDTSVSAIHSHQIPGRDMAGEIIDVLVLDPIPDDDESYRRYIDGIMVYSDLTNDAVIVGRRWLTSARKYMKYKLLSLIRGKAYALKKLEDELFTYPEEKCRYYAMRWSGVPFRFEKRWYENIKMAQFEDIMAMIPGCTGEYLTWHYGDDWMYVPSVSERESHETVSSETAGFQTLREEYLPRISLKRFYWTAFYRKSIGMAIAKEDYELTTHLMEVLAYTEKVKCEKKLRATGVPPEELTEALSVGELAELFADYYAFQFRREIIGREDWVNIYPFNHPVLVELESAYFYAAVYTLFHTNRIAKAKRMIDIWKMHHEAGERLEQIETDILTYRHAANLFFDEDDPRQAEAIVDELLERYPHHISIWKLKLRLNVAAGSDAWKKLSEQCLEMWPEDGEFIKYRADQILENEGFQEAFPEYIAAYEQTSNGLTHLQIMDIVKENFAQVTRMQSEGLGEETMKVLEKMFYGQDDMLQRLYLLWLRQAEDVRAANKILSRLKANESFCEGLREAYSQLGVQEDALDWKVKSVYQIGRHGGVEALLADLTAYVEQTEEEQISASLWKTLGDLYYANGQEREAVAYYQRAVGGELCELERYEVLRTVKSKLWPPVPAGLIK